MDPGNGSAAMVVAVEMGYGHLRAAHTLAKSLGTEVIRMDLPPVAGPVEMAAWFGLRKFYNGLSQACDWPVAGRLAQSILQKITEITPLQRNGNREHANLLARFSDRLTGTVIGRRLRAMNTGGSRTFVATYPAAAMAARHALEAQVFCLATDTDLNRAWAPPDAAHADIDYFAPVSRVADRLRSFGVPNERIHVAGFPLPGRLVTQSRTALTRRLQRLDPAHVFRRQADNELESFIENSFPASSAEPISMMIAVGGAGGQTRQVREILRAMRKSVLEGKLRLNLVAGTHYSLANAFRIIVRDTGLTARMGNGIEILFAADLSEYFTRFEDCLADTDVLWTKPSELVFYAALGLPLLLAPPIGDQEHANRQWLLSHKAALDAGNPSKLDRHLETLLSTGELCRIAWNAYSRLERDGLKRILEILDYRHDFEY